MKRKTSWEKVSSWYDNSVGKKGHYYHEHVVIPGIKRLLSFNEESKFLDLACGQGVLAHALPKELSYTGIDLSPALIKAAKKNIKNKQKQFVVADATKKLPIKECDYTHVAIVLALQNMQEGEKAIKNCSKHLQKGGTLLIILNHPCYRIPRQSSWGIEEKQNLQYRRIDRYLSPLEIPIVAHPGKGKESEQTWSYHNPLSTYTRWLFNSGFAIELMEEWCSNKTSTGKAAKRENRARKEFPLFLAIRATKIKDIK